MQYCVMGAAPTFRAPAGEQPGSSRARPDARLVSGGRAGAHGGRTFRACASARSTRSRPKSVGCAAALLCRSTHCQRSAPGGPPAPRPASSAARCSAAIRYSRKRTMNSPSTASRATSQAASRAAPGAGPRRAPQTKPSSVHWPCEGDPAQLAPQPADPHCDSDAYAPVAGTHAVRQVVVCHQDWPGSPRGRCTFGHDVCAKEPNPRLLDASAVGHFSAGRARAPVDLAAATEPNAEEERGGDPGRLPPQLHRCICGLDTRRLAGSHASWVAEHPLALGSGCYWREWFSASSRATCCISHLLRY